MGRIATVMSALEIIVGICLVLFKKRKEKKGNM